MLGVGLVVAVTVTGAIVLIGSGQDSSDAVSAGYVERRVTKEVRIEGEPVRAVQCVRAEGLPRSFECFVEGPYDLHLAYRVTVPPRGRLVVRAPQ